jgi:hypothetical protein
MEDIIHRWRIIFQVIGLCFFTGVCYWLIQLGLSPLEIFVSLMAVVIVGTISIISISFLYEKYRVLPVNVVEPS